EQRSQQLFNGSGCISDADPQTRLAAMVKLAEFPTTSEIVTLVKRLSVDPQIRGDEWLNEAAKLLVKQHNAVSYKEGPNLLPNPGFELVGADGLPLGWKRRDYGDREANRNAEWKVVATAHSGKNALRCITRGEADTSFYADVTLQPNTEYRLSGWVRSHALRGKVSLNDHVGRVETDRVSGESQWTEVDVTFNSGNRTGTTINVLHVARGDGFWDDVKLCEMIPDLETAEQTLAGDAKRGEQIVLKHQTAACVLCHAVKGQGSTVGPALDGIASRKDAKYLEESLLEPNKALAQGFQQLGVSPMPPMGLVLKKQELEDVKAYLQTLK
ncbi:MAG TPA: c-type cytochrome, partial [Chthoniobacteraceae bacterium]|nr:c-type cytochrome [Chthoniobacteraceae bacterium]